jgi:hypothetical protein
VKIKRSFDEPDESVEFGGVTEQLISLRGLTVSRSVQPVGWDWHTHFQPLVGSTWCQAHHVGAVIAGRQAVRMMDGTEYEFGPGDLYDVPPRHVAWTVGDEDSVAIEWSGMRQWSVADGPIAFLRRCSATSWIPRPRQPVSATPAGTICCPSTITRHRTRSIALAGGGSRPPRREAGELRRSGGPRCGARWLRQLSASQDIAVRLRVHVGEVELAGDDVRGITVHEAARSWRLRGAGEIFVSEQVRLLCQGSGLALEDTGEHELKGVADWWRLYRVAT